MRTIAAALLVAASDTLDPGSPLCATVRWASSTVSGRPAWKLGASGVIGFGLTAITLRSSAIMLALLLSGRIAGTTRYDEGAAFATSVRSAARLARRSRKRPTGKALAIAIFETIMTPKQGADLSHRGARFPR